MSAHAQRDEPPVDGGEAIVAATAVAEPGSTVPITATDSLLTASPTSDAAAAATAAIPGMEPAAAAMASESTTSSPVRADRPVPPPRPDVPAAAALLAWHSAVAPVAPSSLSSSVAALHDTQADSSSDDVHKSDTTPGSSLPVVAAVAAAAASAAASSPPSLSLQLNNAPIQAWTDAAGPPSTDTVMALTVTAEATAGASQAAATPAAALLPPSTITTAASLGLAEERLFTNRRTMVSMGLPSSDEPLSLRAASVALAATAAAPAAASSSAAPLAADTTRTIMYQPTPQHAPSPSNPPPIPPRRRKKVSDSHSATAAATAAAAAAAAQQQTSPAPSPSVSPSPFGSSATAAARAAAAASAPFNALEMLSVGVLRVTAALVGFELVYADGRSSSMLPMMQAGGPTPKFVSYKILVTLVPPSRPSSLRASPQHSPRGAAAMQSPDLTHPQRMELASLDGSSSSAAAASLSQQPHHQPQSSPPRSRSHRSDSSASAREREATPVVVVPLKGWFIYRRYSDFWSLHQKLLSLPHLGGAANLEQNWLLYMPAKVRAPGSFAPSVLETRFCLFDSYVRNLCARTELAALPEVQALLGFDEPLAGPSFGKAVSGAGAHQRRGKQMLSAQLLAKMAASTANGGGPGASVRDMFAAHALTTGASGAGGVGGGSSGGLGGSGDYLPGQSLGDPSSSSSSSSFSSPAPMYSLPAPTVMDYLSTGDLVLFKTSSALSAMQRSLTHSRWDHIGLILARPILSKNKANLCLLESTHGGGIKCNPLEGALQEWRRKGLNKLEKWRRRKQAIVAAGDSDLFDISGFGGGGGGAGGGGGGGGGGGAGGAGSLSMGHAMGSSAAGAFNEDGPPLSSSGDEDLSLFFPTISIRKLHNWSPSPEALIRLETFVDGIVGNSYSLRGIFKLGKKMASSLFKEMVGGSSSSSSSASNTDNQVTKAQTSYFCSELIAACYRVAGLLPVPPPNAASRAYATAEEALATAAADAAAIMAASSSSASSSSSAAGASNTSPSGSPSSSSSSSSSANPLLRKSISDFLPGDFSTEDVNMRCALDELLWQSAKVKLGEEVRIDLHVDETNSNNAPFALPAPPPMPSDTWPPTITTASPPLHPHAPSHSHSHSLSLHHPSQQQSQDRRRRASAADSHPPANRRTISMADEMPSDSSVYSARTPLDRRASPNPLDFAISSGGPADDPTAALPSSGNISRTPSMAGAADAEVASVASAILGGDQQQRPQSRRSSADIAAGSALSRQQSQSPLTGSTAGIASSRSPSPDSDLDCGGVDDEASTADALQSRSNATAATLSGSNASSRAATPVPVPSSATSGPPGGVAVGGVQKSTSNSNLAFASQPSSGPLRKFSASDLSPDSSPATTAAAHNKMKSISKIQQLMGMTDAPCPLPLSRSFNGSGSGNLSNATTELPNASSSSSSYSQTLKPISSQQQHSSSKGSRDKLKALLGESPSPRNIPPPSQSSSKPAALERTRSVHSFSPPVETTKAITASGGGYPSRRRADTTTPSSFNSSYAASSAAAAVWGSSGGGGSGNSSSSASSPTSGQPPRRVLATKGSNDKLRELLGDSADAVWATEGARYHRSCSVAVTPSSAAVSSSSASSSAASSAASSQPASSFSSGAAAVEERAGPRSISVGSSGDGGLSDGLPSPSSSRLPLADAPDAGSPRGRTSIEARQGRLLVDGLQVDILDDHVR